MERQIQIVIKIRNVIYRSHYKLISYPKEEKATKKFATFFFKIRHHVLKWLPRSNVSQRMDTNKYSKVITIICILTYQNIVILLIKTDNNKIKKQAINRQN